VTSVSRLTTLLRQITSLGSMICSTYARSSTLCKADSANRLCQRSAAMQLTLAFLDSPDQPQEVPLADRVSTAWDDVDETTRLTALAILARLIAQMLAADQERETSND